jgi:hypothetical protein
MSSNRALEMLLLMEKDAKRTSDWWRMLHKILKRIKSEKKT